MGAAPVTKIVWPRISREGVANTHFSKLIARLLAAKVLKNVSRWWRCVCLSRGIAGYIAAHIQGLYKVARVHPTGLTVNQGCRQVSTGLLSSSGLDVKEKRSEV